MKGPDGYAQSDRNRERDTIGAFTPYWGRLLRMDRTFHWGPSGDWDVLQLCCAHGFLPLLVPDELLWKERMKAGHPILHRVPHRPGEPGTPAVAYGDPPGPAEAMPRPTDTQPQEGIR